MKLSIIPLIVLAMSCLHLNSNDSSFKDSNAIQREDSILLEKRKDSLFLFSKDFNSLYEKGSLFKRIRTDSLIINNNDTLHCNELHLLYDEQGNLVEKGCQGFYAGMGMCVGTWYIYKNKKLVQEVYYHNDEYGKDYIIFRNYNEKGEYREIITNNFSFYENEITFLSPEEIKKRVR
jgi:hypothetical protein